MEATLTDIEQKQLISLGEKIIFALECDANGTGLPCRTDRINSVEHMVEYIMIHDYKVTRPNLNKE